MILMSYISKLINGEESTTYLNGVSIPEFVETRLYCFNSVESSIAKLKLMLDNESSDGFILGSDWVTEMTQKVSSRSLRLVHFRRSKFDISVIFTFVDDGSEVDIVSDLLIG